MGLFTRTPEADTPAGTRKALPYGAVRPITAAAQRVKVDDKHEVETVKKRRAADVWQNDAWDYYDMIGEVKYAFSLIGSVMSRIRLYPAAIISDNAVPSRVDDVPDLAEGIAEAARTALRKLESANGGIPGLLHDASINLSVAGECYLVQTPAKEGSGIPETWKIKSVDELVIAQGRGAAFGIKTRRTQAQNEIEILPSNAFMGRIWRMHPRYSDEADSSLRALLDLMDELLLLSRTVRATARSRLNAGALFVPDGLSVSAEDDGDSDTTPDPTDTTGDAGDVFEEELLDAMTTPIIDEASASAVVPLIIRGPAELGSQIRLIKFERSFDPQLTQRADKVLERILAGLDIPKDVVTGMASVKYSNAVQIEEALYKQHIEPQCLMLCDALTVIFLRPVLRAMGYEEEDVRRIVIWYDPSPVNTKPDKASASTTGYTNRIISQETWRRANGFSETDAPSNLETAQRVAIERGQLSEPVTEALFKSLIPDLLAQVRDQAQADSSAPMSEGVAQAVGESTSEGGDGLDGKTIPSPGTNPGSSGGGAGQTAGTPASTPPPASPAPPSGLLEPGN